VPAAVAKEITAAIGIPTIGIGAGPATDGQVLVFHDLLGLNPGFNARYVRHFADGGAVVSAGLAAFAAAVAQGEYPAKRESY
jgi:3-methyl-2-oxobutanoate hydroxymethyltransferase